MSKHLALLVTEKFESLPKMVQEQVYQEFTALVYPGVYYMVKERAAAQDVIQEAFLRSINKAPGLTDMDKLEYWLRKLTRNVTLNYLKKHRKAVRQLDPKALESGVEAVCMSSVSTLEDEVEAKILLETILDYVGTIKPDYRRILEMRWARQMTYKEMADELQVTEGIVRQKLYRAREAVRDKIKQEWSIQEKGGL